MTLPFALVPSVFSQTNSLQGGDIPLGGSLRGDQMFPSAAFNSSGGFLVWQDNATDPSGLGISARRLSADLVPASEVIQVNQTIGHDQQRPRVAMLNDGGAVVVYQSGRSGAQNVLARFLTPNGSPVGNEVVVNNAAANLINRYNTNWVLIRNNRPRKQKYRIREKITARQDFNANPSVITLADGSVVTAYASSRVYVTNTFGLNETLRWDDRRSILITNRIRVPLTVRVAGMQDIYMQRLSASGQKLGVETRLNQFTEFNQRDVALAPLNSGNFVATWVSEQQPVRNPAHPSGFNARPNATDVYARVFDGLGNPIGDEFIVSSTNTLAGAPSVTALSGGFAVTWIQRGSDRNNGLDVVVRSFDPSGAPTSGIVSVNSFTFGDQFAPTIVNLGSQLLITWSSMGQDGSWEGVYGRAFQGATPVGDEFRVNVFSQFSQKHGRVAGDGAGRALIFWSGYAVESGFDVFGRSYLAP